MTRTFHIVVRPQVSPSLPPTCHRRVGRAVSSKPRSIEESTLVGMNQVFGQHSHECLLSIL
jgi:hypothetical protein